MAWASTGCAGLPTRSPAVASARRALSPDAVRRNPLPPSVGSIVIEPPRGMVPTATSSMFNKSLTRFFGSNSRGRFHTIVVLSSPKSPRATFSASPRSIWEPAELQLGRGLFRALLDQIKRKNFGFLVLVLVHDFEAVDDGADRADQVVADARAQQRGQIEGADGNGTGRCGHARLRWGLRGLRPVPVTAQPIRQSCPVHAAVLERHSFIRLNRQEPSVPTLDTAACADLMDELTGITMQ